jgi:hypothetical protein
MNTQEQVARWCQMNFPYHSNREREERVDELLALLDGEPSREQGTGFLVLTEQDHAQMIAEIKQLETEVERLKEEPQSREQEALEWFEPWMVEPCREMAEYYQRKVHFGPSCDQGTNQALYEQWAKIATAIQRILKEAE